jgi:hypothetical protein
MLPVAANANTRGVGVGEGAAVGEGVAVGPAVGVGAALGVQERFELGLGPLPAQPAKAESATTAASASTNARGI